MNRTLSELDAKLAHLQGVRAMFAELATPAAHLDQVLQEWDDTHHDAVEEVPDSAAPPQAKRRGRPKGSKNRFASGPRARTHVPEPRALASNIPASPVFVSSAVVAKRQAQPEPAMQRETPQPMEGSLEALIREVEARRSAA